MRCVRRDDFIPPAPVDEGAFLRSAAVVLDTNVLLAPYKLSATAREDALCAIESTAPRLWLPHQVGVEFYRNQGLRPEKWTRRRVVMRRAAA